MLFNSFSFIVFFFIVCTIYFLLPHRLRWLFLLISSYIFYMAWKPVLILLIVFVTFVNYIAAVKLYKAPEKRKKQILAVAMLINFGLLFTFKYLVFINNSLIAFFSTLGAVYPVPEFDIILPMGISFFTFQAAAYTIDVYRGTIKPEKNFGIFSLFITFFPQLVAGPIERSKDLLPQFYEEHKFDFMRMLAGFRIMLLGYFKKIVIADRIAVLVNTVYSSPKNYKGPALIIATSLFAVQIYCDFSGYSDIARGAAKILGFRLMENFKTPYLAKSVKEYWRRWHISLSTWFMDYIYIPLGGGRNGRAKKLRNLFITFAVSGIWHGANWTFIFWGAVHGMYMVVGSLTEPLRNTAKRFLRIKDTPIEYVFGVLISFGLVVYAFIFFRANNMGDALYIAKNFFSDFEGWGSRQYMYATVRSLGINFYELLVIFVSVFILFISELISGKLGVTEFFERRNCFIRWAYYFILAVIILGWGVYYDASSFIYFQF